ncbi:MAG TPA: bifunctional aldolase/short-chain dehydrogenase [Thermoanaerobaculia bacterium]|jgi:rhamnose utilization protein RhaD (predicted bifunctional aldolase and dehydrogenase)/NAD(P)-dependent dehydrogenase (short-subunit alcohol dehydrogenase family)|nr:bifunctional aldolase/short-chain dehydrogenase [Thermoanaerobaculia bacterium]
MKSLWNDEEAARFAAEGGELGLRVYTSRLLGRDKSLVLHGGGNTSVKIRERNLVGEEEDILYVKGSGWDLETIEAAGFAPVRLDHMVRLAGLEELSDPRMVNEMVTHMTRSSAPPPSVETILHAILPHQYVDHTHADAVVTITNAAGGGPGGEARVREIWGDSVVVIPYVMPGFDLARLCARIFPAQKGPRTIGMVLLQHGIFSFGATARESYERMIDLVSLAEEYLASRNAWSLPVPPAVVDSAPSSTTIATVRRDLSRAAGFPLIVSSRRDARSLAFARRPDVGVIAQQGPATPDHVIRTKRFPMLGRDAAGWAEDYRRYFAEHAPQAKEPKTMVDPAPRLVLDPELGLLAAGRRATDAAVAAEIYEHTMDVIERAVLLGGWQALPERDLFDMEYWDLQQAKLKRAGQPLVFAGEVALVTGAASGIGKACAASLLARGAAVVGLDVNPAVVSLHDRKDFLGIAGDITDEAGVRRALAAAVDAFGGLDMLILNAGIFPPGRKLHELGSDEWRRIFAINLDSNLSLFREAHPLLALAPNGGRVVVIGSKNVPAPGPGVGAYSASKAALNQLARVAALEWGKDGIRVNVIHPNAVFDTAIWSADLIASRAAAYGLDTGSYRRNNVLGVEVTSRDVAELAAEMCGPLFAKTTGAQVPVDGGNERVI